MENKRVYRIIWVVMLCACAALIFLPFGGNEKTGADDGTVNTEYIGCSPDMVLSGMSLKEALDSRAPDTVWTETECTGWEKFAFFCEKAFECGDYELFGFSGKMTYCFDDADRLSFSCFRLSEDISAADVFNKVTGELSDTYGEYSRTSFDDYVNGEHHTEEKRWYIITPNKEHMESMRQWEYISIFLDADLDRLTIYQFGWGIDPVPEESGICLTEELYQTYTSRED